MIGDRTSNSSIIKWDIVKKNLRMLRVVIIIIMSRCQHGFPLGTRLYRPSLPGGLPGHILYRHTAVCI